MQDGVKMAKTFRWNWVGNFVIEVFTEGSVDRDDWNLLVADLASNRARLEGALVVTKGGAPSATQRDALRKVLNQGAPIQAAVVTDSQMARIAIAAIGLLLEGNARPRPFAPERLEGAFEYLNIPKALWPECRKAIAEMQQELGVKS